MRARPGLLTAIQDEVLKRMARSNSEVDLKDPGCTLANFIQVRLDL